MAATGPRQGGDGSLADTVLVSNRGPLAFHLEDGVPVARPSAGGLAGSLRPLVAGTGATWVASALGEADRAALPAGLMADDGLRIELVEPEPDDLQHGLQRGVQRHAVVLPPPPLRLGPAAHGPTGGGWRPGTPTASSTSSSPSGWPRWHPRVGGCWSRTTTWR